METKRFFKPTGKKIILALILLLPAFLLGPSYNEVKSCHKNCGFIVNIYYETTILINTLLNKFTSFLHGIGIPKAHEIVLWSLIIGIAGGYYLVSCEVLLAYKKVIESNHTYKRYMHEIKQSVHRNNKIKMIKYRPLSEDRTLINYPS